jgi:signal transduction histidine kinase
LLAKFFRLLGRLFRNIPLIWKAVLIIAGIAIAEICVFFLGYAFGELEEALVLFALAWGFRMIILCPVTLYIVLMMKLLFKGGKELASGNTEYRVNPGPLFGEYRKHAENLNNLSDGINNAVEERMKSERMKTELITNVSHDIKTPLTSIINYSDLIGREAESMYTPDAEENGHVQNIKEYAGVLHNQSGKLKRLMEDLIEVSKANSGNMEVSLETLELGTMLEQVAGEYEGRLESQNLELIINKPDSDVFVTADRGKLWRIMDNLMQNIYKYAHPGTRVYVGMQENGVAGNGMAEVVFKNTSHEPLNLSPEELTERFTRGDSSRHKEGNGLGLAIAKAMAELQSGELRIEVDGDLFKVTVTLPLAEKDEAGVSPDTTATEEIAATAETAAIAETATETEVL